MIEFPEKRVVRLHHFQKRNENHGESLIPAIDLGVTLKGPCSELAMIHKDLPASIFRAGEPPSDEAQASMDLPVDDLSRVRVPSLLMPLKFEHDQVGMLLHIEYGMSGKSDIVLALVKVSKVRVTEKIEGGFCVWQMTLSCSCEITEQIIGKLAMLEGYEITITLTAPEVEPQKAPQLTEADVFPGATPTEPAPKLSVEDVFVNESKPAPAKKVPLAKKIARATGKGKVKA